MTDISARGCIKMHQKLNDIAFDSTIFIEFYYFFLLWIFIIYLSLFVVLYFFLLFFYLFIQKTLCLNLTKKVSKKSII